MSAPGVCEDLLEFRQAWTEFCDTGDEAALMDLLAEDYVWLPSWDAEPELGKAEIRDHLEAANPDTTFESERLIVRDG